MFTALAAVQETKAVTATQDPEAPFQFMAGWLYGISLNTVDVREKMVACAKKDADLTSDMYAIIAA